MVENRTEPVPFSVSPFGAEIAIARFGHGRGRRRMAQLRNGKEARVRSDRSRELRLPCSRRGFAWGYAVGYEAKKTGRATAAVKAAVKKVGNNRKRVERRLRR
jgi:hypothetical protein